MKQDANAVEMSAVASAFKAWDKNGDGDLEVAELTSLKTALKVGQGDVRLIMIALVSTNSPTSPLPSSPASYLTVLPCSSRTPPGPTLCLCAM